MGTFVFYFFPVFENVFKLQMLHSLEKYQWWFQFWKKIPVNKKGI